jgi:outer membrane protein OmpA-like peptidoglycan-associated protein
MGMIFIQSPSSGTRNNFFWFFLVSLVISILFHALFMKRAETWKVPGFSAASYDTIVPRTFRMKRVEIDPKTLKESEQPAKKIITVPVTIDKENPSAAHQAEVQQVGKNLLAQPKEIAAEEKFSMEERVGGKETLLPGLDKINDAERSSSTLDGTQKTAPVLLPDPSEKESQLSGQGGSTEGGINHYSNLDQLLEGGASVTQGTAPILMPTDLLFEYDSDQLKPAAAISLGKLGQLIKKNTEATFRIEGYTDSFGSDDYNLGLSLRRAEAVKAWLLRNMGVDIDRISTAGLGKSRLLVPASGSVQQQQLNRRVEIVISTH